MAKVFEANYKKYNSENQVKIVATSISKALEKAEKVSKKNWGDRVLWVKEIIESVEIG